MGFRNEGKAVIPCCQLGFCLDIACFKDNVGFNVAFMKDPIHNQPCVLRPVLKDEILVI